MIFQIFVLVLLLLFAVNLVLNLVALKRPSRTARVPEPVPFVSILVPARNEEKNIVPCLNSLLKQDYAAYEVIVLDDNSTDGTEAVVSSMIRNDERTRLLKGKPLPDGWAGKPYACQQLAAEAKGSWLLFVDADTQHEPFMLRSVIALATEQRLSLLSGMPRQSTSGLAQKIVMPLMYFVMLSWFPIWYLNKTTKPWPTLAIGQFMLFPRDEYWKLGGHAAVRTRIIEDVWFGAEIRKAGGRSACADLSPVMWTDMYSSVESMSEGWGKWMYSVLAMSPLTLVVLLALAYVCFLAPFLWLANVLLFGEGEPGFGVVIVAQVIALLAMRWMVDRRFREPAGSFVFHPTGILFLVLVAIYSAARRILGAGVTWKGRVYASRSRVK